MEPSRKKNSHSARNEPENSDDRHHGTQSTTAPLPSLPPANEEDTDTYLGEIIDGILLGHDGERGFELEELMDSTPSSAALDLRHYDERDYQSHRREIFPHTHQPLRHHPHSHQRRRINSKLTDTEEGGNFELEAFISPILLSPVLSLSSSPYNLKEGSSPSKKVQFEIGGHSVDQEPQQQPQERKKHRKHSHHHHHHSRQHDDSWRGGTSKGPEDHSFLPLGLNADSMDDLDQENLSTHRFSDNKGYRRHKISSKFNSPGHGEDVAIAVLHKPVKYDHQPHEIFVELDVLSGHGEHRQWKEAARWIKYEEDVLEGSDRWGRPHVASLSFHSLINLRRLIESGVTLLDLEERDLPGVAYRAVEAFVVKELIRPEERSFVMRNILLKHKHVDENEPLWKFNLRRNTTTSGSLTSLHAIIEQDKHNRHHHHHHHRALLGSPNTVPDGLLNGGSAATPALKMPRRNSASSRLTNDDHHHENYRTNTNHHEGILIEDDSLMGLANQISGELADLSLTNLSEEEVKWVLNKESLLRRIPLGAEASIVLVGKDDKLERPIMAFIRLAESSYMPNITEVPIPVRFIYIVLGPSSFDLDYKEIGRSISTLMSNTHFHEIAYKARDRRDMLKGIHDFLDESIVLPPGDWDKELFPFEEMKEKSNVLRKRKETKRRQSSIRAQQLGLEDDGDGKKPPDDDPHRRPPFDHHYNPLQRTKKLFGGMMNDMKKRYKQYLSDIRDGFNFQTLASITFIYFACVSGAIAFGGILGEKTEKHIGISETLIATSAAGFVFSLLSGQPLIILGTTGPLLLFDESLYAICQRNGIDFLAFRFWIGIWVVVIGMLIVALDGSAICRLFSRFVQEIFASLISLLFIYDAIMNIIKVYMIHPLMHSYGNCSVDGGMDMKGFPSPNTALLSTLLTFGTFGIAYVFRLTRTSSYFTLGIRKFMGNFAVPMAIIIMVGMDYGLREMTHTEKLKVPNGLENSKPRSSWLVDISPISVSMAFLAIVPAALVFILMFMETCICALIIGKKEMKLQKGGGYHLDIFLICVINGGLACIGGCWVCAATVRAVAHASSLIVFSTNNPPGEKPIILGVKEQRVSNLIISLLVGMSVLMSPILILIPMSVLFGVFLYMGISSMAGIQFFERCTLLFKQVGNHPQVPYVQRVKTSKMHLFTIIQIFCLVTLFGVKLTPAALSIPFLLILLVPLRLYGLKAVFKPTELVALDGSGEDPPPQEDDDMISDNNNQKPNMEGKMIPAGISNSDQDNEDHNLLLSDLDQEKGFLDHYIDVDMEEQQNSPTKISNGINNDVKKAP